MGLLLASASSQTTGRERAATATGSAQPLSIKHKSNCPVKKLLLWRRQSRSLRFGSQLEKSRPLLLPEIARKERSKIKKKDYSPVDIFYHALNCTVNYASGLSLIIFNQRRNGGPFSGYKSGCLSFSSSALSTAFPFLHCTYQRHYRV